MKKYLIFVLLSLLVVVSSFASINKVIMVTDTGGLGDKSFNDGAWNGVLRASEDLKVPVDYIISKEQTDYIPNLQSAAKQADVVIAVGFMMAQPFFEVSKQYPDTYFIGIDIAPSEGQTLPKNVACMIYRENEPAFLAGYVAAGVTHTGKVGYVGGIAVPAVVKFENGYKAGVKAYNQIHNKNIEVLSAYAGSFGDVAKGKQLALSQYSQGADIIFHAAGLTGMGVYDAAKETAYEFYELDPNKATLVDIINKYWEKGRGYFAIGVDVDQDYIAPGISLTCATKGLSESTYMGIKSARSSRYFMSGVNSLGIKENSAGISAMKYTKGFVPNRILAEIEYLESIIVEGNLVIPESENDLGVFDVTSVSFPF